MLYHKFTKIALKSKVSKIKHVRKGDYIKVISGKYKKIYGSIVKKMCDYAFIDSIFTKKVNKDNKTIRMFTKIHLSNLSLVDKKVGVISKVKNIFVGKKKILIFRKTNNVVPMPYIIKPKIEKI